MTGKIISIRSNYKNELIGKILTEDKKQYQFNKFNLADKTKSLYDFSEGESVQFSPFTDKKGITYAGDVRATDSENIFSVAHSHGDFKHFIFINTDQILSSLNQIIDFDFDCTLDAEKGRGYIYKTIANCYNGLHDNDFLFYTKDGVEALQFPTGFKAKDQSSIMLYCKRNDKEKETGVPWYCERIMCNDNFVGGSLFEFVNANWYTLSNDIKSLSETAKEMKSLRSILFTIEQRNVDRNKSFIWLKNGQIANENTSDSLYVPSGFFVESGKEIFLFCIRKKGIKGYGWYYNCLTYEDAPITVYEKGSWLQRWASFDEISFLKTCEEIGDQTLDEKWSFKNGPDYGILTNYLKYTFARQWTEEKVAYSKDRKYAAFNTGLPDKNTYKYLYILFEAIPISDDSQFHPLYYRSQYKIHGICQAGTGGPGKTLTSNIYPLPTPPQYFTSRSNTVWDLDFNDSSQISTPEIDSAHILIQRCERLPLEFFKSCALYSPQFQAIVNSDDLSLSDKYKQIRQFLMPIEEHNADQETTNVYRTLVVSLENRIDATIRKLSWNWRAVIPCFNPELSEPCYLLPVSFCDSYKPDRALIATVNKFENGSSYNIHTVVPLDWAYLDARLVCRPESEWLGTDVLFSDLDSI